MIGMIGMIGIPGRGTCALCGVSARAGELLCRPHWYQLPRVLRDEVNTTLRRFHNGDVELADLRSVQQAAVDWLRQ